SSNPFMAIPFLPPALVAGRIARLTEGCIVNRHEMAGADRCCTNYCGRRRAEKVGHVLMRALLSTIGSRGDVQPLVALALQLKALGQEAHLCVPPDFGEWIESLGLPMTPIGPEVRPFAASTASG